MKTAVSTGASVAEAQPIAKAGTELAETRILRSDTIQLKMKPGGGISIMWKPPALEPSILCRTAPGQPKRWLKGDRIWMTYGADNRIHPFVPSTSLAHQQAAPT